MIDPPYYTLRMAMGKRKRDQQPTIWVAVNDLPRSVSHPFYEKLNRLLAEQGFDDFVETQCRPFYADTMGRNSLLLIDNNAILLDLGRMNGFLPLTPKHLLNSFAAKISAGH